MMTASVEDHGSNPQAAEGAIGVATMEAGGDIVLRLRAATGEPGGVGEGYFRYAPDHPQYEEVRSHVGGLEPGQSKPVPPWPDGGT